MPLNTRAIIFPRCVTGYQNPDTGSCVSPRDVHWVEGIGFPNAATVGRNTLRTGGTNNFDLNLTKSIPLGENASAGAALGSAERLKSSAVRQRAPNEREQHTGRLVSQSRFHRQRHPQHVGAGDGRVLKRFFAHTEHARDWTDEISIICLLKCRRLLSCMN